MSAFKTCYRQISDEEGLFFSLKTSNNQMVANKIQYGKFYIIGHGCEPAHWNFFNPSSRNFKYSWRSLVLPIGFFKPNNLLVYTRVSTSTSLIEGAHKIDIVKLHCDEGEFIFNYRIATKEQIANLWPLSNKSVV